MPTKKTITEVEQFFRRASLRLLTKTYKNSKSRLRYRCEKCGQQAATTFNAVQQGHFCNSCGPKEAARKSRDSIASVRQRFADRNLVLLSDNYQGAFHKLPYKCLICGYEGVIAPNKVPIRGCKRCGIQRRGQSRKLTAASLDELLAAKKLRHRDSNYENCLELIELDCVVCGHRFAESPARIKAYAHPCPKCRQSARKEYSHSRKRTLEEAVSAFSAVGLQLLASEYRGNLVAMPYRCPDCGYLGRKSFNSVSSKKTGCWHCGAAKAGIQNRLQQSDIDRIARNANVTFLRQPTRANERVAVRFNTCGHEGQEKSPEQLKLPRSGCSVCSGKLRKTKNDYISLAKKHGGQLVEMAVNVATPSCWRCRIGHVFPRSYSSIVAGGNSSFCSVCSTKGFAEMRCQAILEDLFSKHFQKGTLPGARGTKGKLIQIDMINIELRLAVEHHGVQHFKPIEYWGGEQALARQQERDQILRDACNSAGIVLLEVRQLGQVTSLEDFRKMVALACNQAKPPILLPSSFWKVDLEKITYGSAASDYWRRAVEAAARLGFISVSKVYSGAINDHDWICSRGHFFHRAPRQILFGRTKDCPECYRLRREKPVLLSDGRSFANETLAAVALGVRKTSVNHAVRKKGTVKGHRAWHIAQSQFAEFVENPSASLFLVAEFQRADVPAK